MLPKKPNYKLQALLACIVLLSILVTNPELISMIGVLAAPVASFRYNRRLNDSSNKTILPDSYCALNVRSKASFKNCQVAANYALDSTMPIQLQQAKCTSYTLNHHKVTFSITQDNCLVRTCKKIKWKANSKMQLSAKISRPAECKLGQQSPRPTFSPYIPITPPPRGSLAKISIHFIVDDLGKKDLENTLQVFSDSPIVQEFLLYMNKFSSFEHAIVQIPVCAPSRGSFLTGTRPSNNKGRDFLTTALDYNPQLNDFTQTAIANNAKAYLHGKVWHAKANEGIALNRGASQVTFDKTGNAQCITLGVNAYYCKNNDSSMLDFKIAQDAINTVQACHTKQELCSIFVGFHRPHIPYEIPSSQYALLTHPATYERVIAAGDYFNPDYLKADMQLSHQQQAKLIARYGELLYLPYGLVSNGNLTQAQQLSVLNPISRLCNKIIPGMNLKKKTKMRSMVGCGPNSFAKFLTKFTREAINLYTFQLGSILGMLQNFNLVMRKISSLYKDDFYAVLVSDHGLDPAGRHARASKGAPAIDDIARVPYYVHVPNIVGSKKYEMPVELLTLYATWMEVMGFTPANPIYPTDSVSLLPILQGPSIELAALKSHTGKSPKIVSFGPEHARINTATSEYPRCELPPNKLYVSPCMTQQPTKGGQVQNFWNEVVVRAIIDFGNGLVTTCKYIAGFSFRQVFEKIKRQDRGGNFIQGLYAKKIFHTNGTLTGMNLHAKPIQEQLYCYQQDLAFTGNLLLLSNANSTLYRQAANLLQEAFIEQELPYAPRFD